MKESSSHRKCILQEEEPSLLLYIIDTVFFSRRSLFGRFIGISQNAVADSFIISFDAKAFQEFFSFLLLKFLFGSVNPAAADPQIMGGQHQIGHDKAAVIQISRYLFIGQDYQHYRRTTSFPHTGRCRYYFVCSMLSDKSGGNLLLSDIL